MLTSAKSTLKMLRCHQGRLSLHSVKMIRRCTQIYNPTWNQQSIHINRYGLIGASTRTTDARYSLSASSFLRRPSRRRNDGFSKSSSRWFVSSLESASVSSLSLLDEESSDFDFGL